MPSLPRILWDVLKGKRVLLVSDYAVANMVFIVEVSLRLAKKNTVYVAYTQPIRLELFHNIASTRRAENLLEKIILLDSLKEDKIGRPLIVYGVDYAPLDALSSLNNAIVFATAFKAGKLARILRARIAKLKRITSNEYLVEYGYSRFRVIVDPSKGVLPVRESMPSNLARALEELSKAMSEYGPLTYRDAVYVLMGSLKIDKKEAQEILRTLTMKRYIRIEGGYILLEDYSI